jgi:hypothetical protein
MDELLNTGCFYYDTFSKRIRRDCEDRVSGEEWKTEYHACAELCKEKPVNQRRVQQRIALHYGTIAPPSAKQSLPQG